MGDRYTSPLGDRRERPVPCQRCGQPTWTLDAVCERCCGPAPEPPPCSCGVCVCLASMDAFDALALADLVDVLDGGDR